MNLLDLSVNITCNDQASSKIDSLGASTIAKGTAIGSMVSQGITAAASAVVDFGKQTIQTGMSFDSSMSQVAATMGTTTDQIGEMRDFAQQMGATTKFSATEAADAMNYMALAGYDANTTMSMLPTVLDLAASGGMDLASASDMVTDSQTALGLSIDETTVLVDQMAQTASKSNTSVSQLGDAILTVGGTAKNLSGGITEMNTVLGVLADNSIKGSEGGTHLRNIILSLTAPTSTAATALAQLGVSATDADGNMRPLQDTMADFNKAFEHMTAEEKTQALSKIFNKTDLAAVNALLDTSADRWEELGSAIEDSEGAASQMSATMQDNLEGDLTTLNSALEGVQIALSDMMTPALREMTQTASTGFQQMGAQLKEGDIIGGFTTLGETVATLASQFLTYIPQMVDAGMQMITGLIQGLANGAPELVTTATQMIIDLAQTIITNAPQMMQSGMNLITGLVQGVTQSIPLLTAAIPPLITQAITVITTMLPQMVQAGITLFTGLSQAVTQAIPTIVAALPGLVSAAVNALVTLLPMLLQAGVTLFTGIAQSIPQVLPVILGAIPSLINTIVQGLLTLVPQIVQAGIQLFSAIVQNIPAIVAQIAAALPSLISALVQGILTLIPMLAQCR